MRGDSDEAETVDRRQLIKKAAAGAAVAGVVWSAPRVEGLTLRPSYASAGSPSAGPIDFTFAVPGSTSQPLAGGNVMVTANVVAFNFVQFNIAYNGPGVLTLSGVDATPNPRSPVILHFGHSTGNSRNVPAGSNNVGLPNPSNTQIDIAADAPTQTRMRFSCA